MISACNLRRFTPICAFWKWCKAVPVSAFLHVLLKHIRPPNLVTVTATPTQTLFTMFLYSPTPPIPSFAISRFMAPGRLMTCVCERANISSNRYTCIHLSAHARKLVKRTCMDMERCEHGPGCFAWTVSGLCNSPHKWIAGLQPLCSLSWAHRETGSRRCSWRWTVTSWPEFSWGQGRWYQRNSQSKVGNREKAFPSVFASLSMESAGFMARSF